jgi:alkylation response protein AidB-like acyl-CoA dehydrogenase
MDTATIELVHANIAAWCLGNASVLDASEQEPWGAAMSARIFAELDELGVLHVLHDPTLRDEMRMVAEIAYGFARRSPSMALLVLQQNMAALLLAETGQPAPTGWVALPLYDGAAEWASQLRVDASTPAFIVSGTWRSFPALPIANHVLLPVDGGDPARFALIQIKCGALPLKAVQTPDVLMLGLRGCPVGDLHFHGTVLAESGILASGAEIQALMTVLWSQAEVGVLAIRAAILERSYTVACDYAALRWQGGKIIIEHSLVRKMLADLHLAQSLLAVSWRAMASALQPGKPLTAGQMGIVLQSAVETPRHASDGMQLLGGNGYMADYGQEGLFRDAKQCEMLLGHPQAKRFTVWENA